MAILNQDANGAEVVFEQGRKTTSIGRNGKYTTIGVDIYLSSNKTVNITGINSKGYAATGYTCIPKEDLPEFIEALKQLL